MLLVVASAAAAALIAQHPSPLWHGKPPAERQRFVAAAQAAAPAADEPSDFMKFLEETRPREPPPSKEPPSKERADLGADLVEWLRAGGAECDAVEVASLAGYGRGLVAKRAIEAGDLVLSVPAAMILSPSGYVQQLSQAGAIGAQLGQALAPLLHTADGQASLLALALLRELALGDRSRFKPLLAALPPAAELEVPLLWSPARLEALLGGSHLVARVTRLREDLEAEHASFDADLFAASPADFPPQFHGRERYLWAHAIVLSRALPLGEESCLCPLLEMANHQQGCTHEWTRSASTGTAALLAGEGSDLKPGDQVFIDYGRGAARCSWELFYSHGFVPTPRRLEPNGGDSERGSEGASEGGVAYWQSLGGRPLQVQVLRASDPLLERKKSLLLALGADDDVECGVEVYVRPGALEEGAPVLRLGQLDEATAPQLAALLATAPLEAWAALQRPVGDEVERRVAALLVASCEQALRPLPPAAELATLATAEDEEAGAEAAAGAALERAAARVLLGERHALEACREHWLEVGRKLAAST